ncbi:MAG: hypothetical protein JO020_26130 [Chloroflexi bacterium]|nr:hypothetical protein [Chloroflexota bacterium]
MTAVLRTETPQTRALSSGAMGVGRLGLALAIGGAVMYLALVTAQLNRPLMYDDANFALAARAVADTGLPFGNQGWMSERGDLTQREQWALWHPPLYIYALGAFARVGGWTPPVLRGLGILGGLATLLLTWLLARDLTRGPPPTRDLAGGLAVAVVAVCPLVVQSTLILDIDFSVLLPLSLLFLWLYPRLQDRGWFWLTPLFALLLWAKMTNPITLIAVLGTWQVLRGRFLRAVVHVIGIGGVGALLAAAFWIAIGTWLRFPLDMPFGVNLIEAQDSADVARRAYVSAGAFIEGLQPTVIWLGPGLVTLGLLGAGARLAGLARLWQMRRVDLLIGVTILLVLLYVNKSAGWFPKYQVPLAPLLACMAAPVVAGLAVSRLRVAAIALTASALLSGGISLWLVRDQWALERTWAIAPAAAASLLGVLVVATLVGISLRAPAITGCMAVVGLALGWSLAVDVVQVAAPYQTDYWYGTTGTLEAAAWVDAHLAPNDTYVSSKEVAIRSNAQRYVDQDNLVYLLSIGRPFESTWLGEPLHALVIWERDPYIADLMGRTIPHSQFAEVARFGDYAIYAASS